MILQNFSRNGKTLVDVAVDGQFAVLYEKTFLHTVNRNVQRQHGIVKVHIGNFRALNGKSVPTPAKVSSGTASNFPEHFQVGLNRSQA